jgi:hypothetical protein
MQLSDNSHPANISHHASCLSPTTLSTQYISKKAAYGLSNFFCNLHIQANLELEVKCKCTYACQQMREGVCLGFVSES